MYSNYCGVMVTEQDEKVRTALFESYKPKKPVELKLDGRRLKTKKKARDLDGDPTLEGYATFDHKEEVHPESEEEKKSLVLENLATITKGYGGLVVAETKLDGYNLSLKISEDGEIEMLTSSGNPFPGGLFPELEESLDHLRSLGPQIYIGEMHGIPPDGFQEFSNANAFSAIRSRMDLAKNQDLDEDRLEELVTSSPLQLSLYDTYLSGGKLLLDSRMEDRRNALEELIDQHDLPGIGLTPSHRFKNPEDIYNLYLQEIAKEEEGLVLKNPLAIVKYSFGKNGLSLSRTADFIKLKRDLVLDLIVIGTFLSDGARDKGLSFSNLLLGVRNEQTGLIETLCKTMGVHPSSEAYQEIADLLEEKRLAGVLRPGYTVDGRKKIALPDPQVVYSKRLTGAKLPDEVIIDPLQNGFVVRLHGMQITKTYTDGKKGGSHSAGNTYLTDGLQEAYSVRHPVLVGVHEDKRDDPFQSETTEKIRSLS